MQEIKYPKNITRRAKEFLFGSETRREVQISGVRQTIEPIVTKENFSKLNLGGILNAKFCNS